MIDYLDRCGELKRQVRRSIAEDNGNVAHNVR